MRHEFPIIDLRNDFSDAPDAALPVLKNPPTGSNGAAESRARPRGFRA